MNTLSDSPAELIYLPAHEAATRFSLALDGLAEYDTVILSGISANTLLLHSGVWQHSKRKPNRRKLIYDFVVGGSEIGAASRDVVLLRLPREFYGFLSKVGHRATQSTAAWTRVGPISGLNKGHANSNAAMPAKFPDKKSGSPLLIAGHYSKGHTLAWTS